MKKAFQNLSLAFLFCLFFSFTRAQAPQGINYQAVARDGSGSLLTNTAISVEFKIHKGGATGTVSYSETHNPTTNDYGLFDLVIGGGTPGSGAFDAIDWHGDSYFLEVSIDGTSISTMQLMSVPYALSIAPRKQYYSIPGAVFHPNTNGPSYYSSVGQGGAEITAKGGTSTNVLGAPVNLPHGAKIQKFTAFFKDESTAQDFSIVLNRENMTAGFFDPIATITTSGDTPGWRSDDIAVADEVVDNITYGHFIRVFCSDWDAAGRKAIKGVLIEYTY